MNQRRRRANVRRTCGQNSFELILFLLHIRRWICSETEMPLGHVNGSEVEEVLRELRDGRWLSNAVVRERRREK